MVASDTNGEPGMTEAAELFEAFGFERLENGLWRFAKHFEGHPDAPGEGVNDTAVVIVEALPDGSFVGHVPFVESCRMDLDEVPERSLFFPSADPRDMIALAQNEAGSSYHQTTGHTPDEGFGDEATGMFITFPFMSDPWSDYAVTPDTKQEDSRYELVSPAEAYAGYVEWRDALCEGVLAAPQPSSTR